MCVLLCSSSGAEIVVGTPGRVIDFVETGKFPLDKVGYCVPHNSLQNQAISSSAELRANACRSSCCNKSHCTNPKP
jgi:hypothetical protein